MNPLARTPLVAFLLAAGLTACSGGSGGSGATAPSTVTGTTNLFVGSVAADELFAFHAELERVQLVGENGSRSADLLPAETALEFVGLEEEAAWVAQSELEGGTYTAIEVTFDPAAFEAMSESGNAVDIQAGSTTWMVELDEPLVVSDGSSSQLYLELDLEASMSNVVPLTSAIFDANGDAYVSSIAMDVEEFRGVVTAASADAGTLTVNAVIASSTSLGQIDVKVVPATVLVDEGGAMFNSPAEFFAALTIGQTVVKVRGKLQSDGSIEATGIAIIEQSTTLVEIEGRVLHIDNGFFVLLIRDVELGGEIAKPVLHELGNPSSIDVQFTATTNFVLANGTPVTANELKVGQIVDTEFDAFVAPTFTASKVKIQHQAIKVRGNVSDIAGLPESFVMRHFDFGWAFSSWGLFQIKVLIDGAPIVLDVRSSPELEPSQIIVSQPVAVVGFPQPSTQIDERIIAAERIIVRHGKLERANVAAAQPAASAFDTTGGEITKSFGVGVSDGPLHIKIDPRARFKNAAHSEEEFYALFDSLSANQKLVVEIRGIGTGQTNEILAFEIRSSVLGLATGG